MFWLSSLFSVPWMVQRMDGLGFVEGEPTLVCNGTGRGFVLGTDEGGSPRCSALWFWPSWCGVPASWTKGAGWPRVFPSSTYRSLLARKCLPQLPFWDLPLPPSSSHSQAYHSSHLPAFHRPAGNPFYPSVGRRFHCISRLEKSPLLLFRLLCEKELNTAFLSPQAVPADNSQFIDPAAAWDVRAVSIEGTVSPYEPYTRVLFHLQGQHWMSEHQALPCVTLHVFHQGQAVHRTCHLQVGT